MENVDTAEAPQYTEKDLEDHGFRPLGLDPKILRAISELGYETPTPIQKQAIPLVLDGNDLMGLAQTGTGKTAAFGLPLVHQLMKVGGKPDPKTAKALILAPTRELVNQIADNLKQYVRKTPLRINLVIGGQSINAQVRNLARGTDILIATPGRLLDLVDRKALYLDTVKFLVLDEADQMLDLGFIHSLRKIAKMLGRPRQTMLFSATMPRQVEELSNAFLDDPVRVQVSPPGRAADKVKQCVHFAQQRDKTELLKDLLIKHPDDLSLIFARTKHGAEKLMKHLVHCGFRADSIHGNKSQGQRDRALKAFKRGDINILVATDVAARGIDIPGVGQVYNYNLPEVPENYVHRIGRTARAGAEGEAIALCAPDEAKMLRGIEKLMGISIEVAGGVKPEWQQESTKGKSKNHRKGRSGNKPANSRGEPSRSRGPAREDRSHESSNAKPGQRRDKPSYGKHRSPDRANEGEDNRFEKKRESRSGEKPFGDRRPKADGDKPFRDRKPKADGDRPFRDSKPKADGDKPYENRKPRTDGDKPYKDRKPKADGDRDFGGHKNGKGGNKWSENRKPKFEGEKPAEDRKPRSPDDKNSSKPKQRWTTKQKQSAKSKKSRPGNKGGFGKPAGSGGDNGRRTGGQGGRKRKQAS